MQRTFWAFEGWKYTQHTFLQQIKMQQLGSSEMLFNQQSHCSICPSLASGINWVKKWNDMLAQHCWSHHTQQRKLWTIWLFLQCWQFHLFWNDLSWQGWNMPNIRQHCIRLYAMTKQISALEIKSCKINLNLNLEILVLNRWMRKNHPKELGRAKSDLIEDWSRCDLRWNLNKCSKNARKL